MYITNVVGFLLIEVDQKHWTFYFWKFPVGNFMQKMLYLDNSALHKPIGIYGNVEEPFKFLCALKIATYSPGK